MTDYPDYLTAEHHALTIFNQGVPLARKPSLVATNNLTLAGGQTQTMVNAVTITQPSWQLVIFLEQTSVIGTIPFGLLTFSWTDTASGFTIVTDEPVLPAGQQAFSVFLLTGPAEMDVLTVTIKNLDPSVIMHCNYGISQNSHLRDRLRIRETTPVAVTGFTRPGIDLPSGNLGSVGAGIPASSSVARLAGTWWGDAILASELDAGPQSCLVQLLDPGVVLGTGALYSTAGLGLIAAQLVGAGSAVINRVALPQGPVVIKESNLGTTGTITPTTTLMAVAD